MSLGDYSTPTRAGSSSRTATYAEAEPPRPPPSWGEGDLEPPMSAPRLMPSLLLAHLGRPLAGAVHLRTLSVPRPNPRSLRLLTGPSQFDASSLSVTVAM